MKKIDIKKFDVEINGEKIPYKMKESIKGILFNPQLRLNSIGLIQHHEIWDKIKNQEDELLLENADYNEVKKCVETFEGYNEFDKEFVLRVINAQNCEIQEKK